MKLYNDYNSFLKSRYGCKVYRIGLDGGFSCPNRDGTKGYGGCIYCNGDGSRSSYIKAGDSVTKQLETRIKYLKEKEGARKFIAYFQAFTNTYADTKKLKDIYNEVVPFQEVVGLSIGTRPDTIDRGKLSLIAGYNNRFDVWMEYGLQSIHDKTLAAINRGHNFASFVSALNLAREFHLSVTAHVILGLPGETKDDMLETARKLSELKVDGVKIHLLHILKGSPLEKAYREGKVRIIEQDEYVGLVCDFLENLSDKIVIERLTGQGPKSNHAAPLWALDKIGTINKIKVELNRRESCQGSALPISGFHHL